MVPSVQLLSPPLSLPFFTSPPFRLSLATTPRTVLSTPPCLRTVGIAPGAGVGGTASPSSSVATAAPSWWTASAHSATPVRFPVSRLTTPSCATRAGMTSATTNASLPTLSSPPTPPPRPFPPVWTISSPPHSQTPALRQLPHRRRRAHPTSLTLRRPSPPPRSTLRHLPPLLPPLLPPSSPASSPPTDGHYSNAVGVDRIHDGERRLHHVQHRYTPPDLRTDSALAHHCAEEDVPRIATEPRLERCLHARVGTSNAAVCEVSRMKQLLDHMNVEGIRYHPTDVVSHTTLLRNAVVVALIPAGGELVVASSGGRRLDHLLVIVRNAERWDVEISGW